VCLRDGDGEEVEDGARESEMVTQLFAMMAARCVPRRVGLPGALAAEKKRRSS